MIHLLLLISFFLYLLSFPSIYIHVCYVILICLNLLRFYLWNTILSITNFLSTKWSCKSPFEGWRREIHLWSTHQGREGTESWIPEAHQERLPHSVRPRPVRDLYQKNKADGVWETTSEVAIWFLHTCVLITIYMCTDTSTHCVHTHRKGKTPSLMAESWFF